jgi:predicted DCC family thiol-disulfide oxidoreductase YuxK
MGLVTDQAVFLFDGDCGFCTRSAMFLRRHVSAPARIVPWQTVDLRPLGVTAVQCSEAVQYVSPGRVSPSGAPKVTTGPVAIADLLRTATRPRHVGWRLAGTALAVPPVRALAWPVYRWVARHRHQLPGGTAACELPRPDRA